MRILILSLFLLLSANALAPLAVASDDLTSYQQKQISCLAQNIFFESGAEPIKGQLAVGMVTMNRTKSDMFPDSVCGVVKQKVKGFCQFSWVCDPAKQISKVKYTQTYKNAVKMATHIYLEHEDIPDVTKGSLYFHASTIQPEWTNLMKTMRIGNHVFYKPKKKDYNA
jgi:spore germination cell wall hydrolase CwlJ-like protein